MGRFRIRCLAGFFLLAALPCLAQEGVLPKVGFPDGRSAEDLAWEEILSRGEVVAVKQLENSSTKPRRFTLRLGDQEVKAVFKTIDIEDTENLRLHNRFEFNFTDKFIYDVAAYRLDRFLGLGMVPVTVPREYNGEKGSLQAWVEGATSLQILMRDGGESPDPEQFLREKTEMDLFDGLIHNIDRGAYNILVSNSDGHLFLIDHSRAFRLDRRLPEMVEDWKVPVRASLIAKLQELDAAKLQALVGDFLTAKQIEAILKRRDIVLKKVHS